VVSLLYAAEPLAHSRAHSGIIALNPPAANHAHVLAPKAKVANLGWGMDLDFYKPRAYNPHWFLSCGRTRRDDKTLHAAAHRTKQPLRVFAHAKDHTLNWPANVEVVPGGDGWESRLSYAALLEEHYLPAAASLVVVRRDDTDATACGFTGILEAMALARPVVATNTGAIRSELDVEKSRCGLSILPDDPDALAQAVDKLASDPAAAENMGMAGRHLVQSHYNMDRFARDLHDFFNAL
jgi:glycosyltransferase involved in cell wall biosynthesis